MLYCPKCRSTYEEGTQRFCSNDGGRLLPATEKPESGPTAGGVFTNILGKMPHKDKGDATPAARTIIRPKFEQPPKPEPPKTHAPISKLYESQRQIEHAPIAFDDDDSILELDFDEPLDAPVSTPRPAAAAPAVSEASEESEPLRPAKLVDPREIPSGTADVGDRSVNPAGRKALSWDNPRAIIGTLVKGRYMITELIGDDEDSLEYLADDRIAGNKRAIVRVFMDDQAYEERYAEERISLSHLNHPNIAPVFDSGELQEGFRFVVSEFVDGQSLAAQLRSSGQFNPKRAARIVRQISYALSEAHQNGILHRNLKPENVMLTASEAGIELVKLINFELSNSFFNESDLVYRSPEEIRGDDPTFASEIYSLAIIAYEMLTARLPFNALSERELLAAQEKGLSVPPTALRLDVPELGDKILEKALNYDPAERYPKARDFGDAFFNAMTAVSPWEKPAPADAEIEVVEEAPKLDEPKREFIIVPPVAPPATAEVPVNGDITIKTNGHAVEESIDDAEPAAVREDEHKWVKRSPEPPQTTNWLWGILPIVGAVVVLIALWGAWKMFDRIRSESPAIPEPTAEQTAATPTGESILPPEVDKPPQPRTLTPVEGTARYVNRQESLKGDLARNFLGFEIFYPQDMKRNESTTNFLDISTTENGVPVEQMLVTHYQSRGSMALDRPNFKKISAKSNDQLRTYFKDSFKLVGEGETVIQGDRWKAYEVKFEGDLPDGTHVFGRRLWIPMQRPGVKPGFVITLLGTSLSDEIKSVNDVGTKGRLAVAIENFEPEQN